MNKLVSIMKSIHFQKLFFTLFLLSGAFFANPSSALADDAVRVFHERDSGMPITLEVGEKIQFTFAEMIPDSTPWSCSIAWWSVDSTIALSDGAPVYDLTQNLNALTQETAFTCFGAKEGNSILYFYKEDKNNPGVIVETLIFSIHVQESAQALAPR